MRANNIVCQAQASAVGADKAVPSPWLPSARATFEALLAGHLPRLRSAAMRLCRALPDAEDLLQETLLRAFMAFASFEPGARPLPWLLAIMRNTFVDLQRRRARWCVHDDGWFDALPSTPQDEVAVWRTVDSSLVELAARNLDENLSAPFTLRWIEHRSYSEIAMRLGIPTSTVGTRLLRARGIIRAAVKRELAY